MRHLEVSDRIPEFGRRDIHLLRIDSVFIGCRERELLGMLCDVKGVLMVFGGDFDEKTLKIQPTILDGATADDPAMQEEIFGPVLPVLTFRTFDEAKQFIAARPSPLALYYFGKKNEQSAVMDIRFGGGCINDTVMHLATSHMGFGGVGESGMGAYHGQRGFEAFSHIKSIQKKGTMELSLRYAPYSDKKLKSLKKYIH